MDVECGDGSNYGDRVGDMIVTEVGVGRILCRCIDEWKMVATMLIMRDVGVGIGNRINDGHENDDNDEDSIMSGIIICDGVHVAEVVMAT